VSSSPLSLGTTLSLPPVYRLRTLREIGNAFVHAQTIANEGAGTLVWARRYHVADFAVVLEPERALVEARLAFYAAMNALADALSLPCPPEKPILFGWPDTILIDGGLAGGGRLAWPDKTRDEEPPDWMVFGAIIRISAPAGEEIGRWDRGTTLEEEGFEEFSTEAFIESVSRHLLSAMHDFEEMGPDAEMKRYLTRLSDGAPEKATLAANGDIRRRTGKNAESFPHALSFPTWLDPATGEPWR
jgi:hypothetical protein